jgi:adenosylhomocysteine nucleosidase
MKTWLLVAAERREFDGILKRLGTSEHLDWPDARFARQAEWKQDRWLLVANGPGPGLVEKALRKMMSGKNSEVNGVISTGFCGALDPSLKLGDIVVGAESTVACGQPFVRGRILSIDRVAVASSEKRELRTQTGAVAIEMESAAVATKASEWGVPFHCIRVVSDTAADNLPLDFNRYRDAEGRFSRTRIALTAMARPFSVMPGLLAFDRNCRLAAEALGEFLADCRF